MHFVALVQLSPVNHIRHVIYTTAYSSISKWLAPHCTLVCCFFVPTTKTWSRNMAAPFHRNNQALPVSSTERGSEALHLESLFQHAAGTLPSATRCD